MGQYAYPTTVNLTKGMDGFFVYLNTVTNGWFANLLLIATFVLFASGFYFGRRDIFGAFAVGGFATLIFGTFLWLGGIIGGVTFTIVVAIAIIGFATLFIEDQ